MRKKMANQFSCSQMFLPEHREQLNNQYNAIRMQNHSPAHLDEQERERFDRILRKSLAEKLLIRVIIFTPEKREALQVLKGTMQEQVLPGYIKLKTASRTMLLPLKNIVAVEEDPSD